MPEGIIGCITTGACDIREREGSKGAASGQGFLGVGVGSAVAAAGGCCVEVGDT